MNRAGARTTNFAQTSVTRLRGHILPVGTRPIRQELPRATASVAERKRSRSEVDTGRRIGASFGLEWGESDTLAARGGLAEDELHRMGLQLVGARCCSPLAANCYRVRTNGSSFCDPTGRAGRTPPLGRPATRRLRVENCGTFRASVHPKSTKSRVEAGIKRRLASVYSERHRN